MPLEEWKQKLDYEENRKNDAEIMNQLKRDNIIKNEIFEKLKEYKIKTYQLFKNILNKFNEINGLINAKPNNLDLFIEDFSYDDIDIQIDNISNKIFAEFKKLEEIIKNKGNLINLNNKKNEINDEKLPKNINKPEIIAFNQINQINKNNNKFKEIRNEIELIYYSKLGGAVKLFGTEFVNFNKNNIKLIINNGKVKQNIIDTFYLSKGNNKIRLFIEKKLNNLSYMFYNSNSLKNISELKYLDTSEVINFSYLFWGCSSLTDISPLSNWDVSKGKDFSYAFTGCSSLSDISALEK